MRITATVGTGSDLTSLSGVAFSYDLADPGDWPAKTQNLSGRCTEFEELTRPFSDASQLASLRVRVLSDEPEQALDLALHKAFCGSAEFQPEYTVKGPKMAVVARQLDRLGR